jgi:hypothetical protein
MTVYPPIEPQHRRSRAIVSSHGNGAVHRRACAAPHEWLWIHKRWVRETRRYGSGLRPVAFGAATTTRDQPSKPVRRQRMRAGHAAGLTSPIHITLVETVADLPSIGSCE